MIAEICIHHAKMCVTQLRDKTTLQNSFKNQRLIPLIIRVKKASGFNLVKQVRFELVVKISHFVNYSIVTDYALILSGSSSRLNAFFIKQLLDIRLAFPPTLHESTSLIQFTSLKLSQPASSLFFSTQLANYGTRLETQLSKFSRNENGVSSRVLQLASDCQLTVERYCINLKIKVVIE